MRVGQKVLLTQEGRRQIEAVVKQMATVSPFMLGYPVVDIFPGDEGGLIKELEDGLWECAFKRGTIIVNDAMVEPVCRVCQLGRDDGIHFDTYAEFHHVYKEAS